MYCDFPTVTDILYNHIGTSSINNYNSIIISVTAYILQNHTLTPLHLWITAFLQTENPLLHAGISAVVMRNLKNCIHFYRKNQRLLLLVLPESEKVNLSVLMHRSINRSMPISDIIFITAV